MVARLKRPGSRVNGFLCGFAFGVFIVGVPVAIIFWLER